MDSGKGRSDHDQEKIKDFIFDTTGLRALVVDDDRTCLQIVGTMLQICKYEVKTCKTAKEAMSILREDKNKFDIVLTDLHMPDMNGVSLLEFIGLDMDLPVVIMSQSDSKEDIIDGIAHGACDYLVKPITMEAIKMLWKNVIIRNVKYCSRTAKAANHDEGEIVLEGSNSKELAVIPNNRICKEKTPMKRKIDDDKDENLDACGKKKRFVWSQELHQKFVAAVEELGFPRAVPKKIFELMTRMNVPNITRENIASHLQKYRLSSQKNPMKSLKEKSFMEANTTPLQSVPSMDILNIGASRQSNSNSFVDLQNNIGLNYHPGSTSSQPAPMQHLPCGPSNIESNIPYHANINRLSNLYLAPNSGHNNILANSRFGAVPWPTTNPISGTGSGMSSVTNQLAESSTTKVVPGPTNFSSNRNIGYSNYQFSNLPIIQRSNSIEDIFGINRCPRLISVDYSEMLETHIPESFSFPITGQNMPGIMRTSSSENFYNMLAWNQLQQGENNSSNIAHQITSTDAIGTEHEKDVGMPDLSFNTLLPPKNP